MYDLPSSMCQCALRKPHSVCGTRENVNRNVTIHHFTGLRVNGHGVFLNQFNGGSVRFSSLAMWGKPDR